MQGYCDVYNRTILKRTSPEVKCLHPTSSRREMCTSSVRNVINHKFSHGAAFYTLNGKNVNVMLELFVFRVFLSVFLSDKTLAKSVLLIKKRFCSQRNKFFPFCVKAHWEGRQQRKWKSRWSWKNTRLLSVPLLSKEKQNLKGWMPKRFKDNLFTILVKIC